MKRTLSTLFAVYRAAASALWPACCRFEPSCSRYAEEALLRHGPLRGGRLALARLLRCHPMQAGGRDAVPGRA